jgi:mutator protein MutT
MVPITTAGSPLKEVAIGLVMKAGQLLVCRRKKDGELAGYWEFPGGKCEPGESPEQCLVRELQEEVGVAVVPVHAFRPIVFTYPHATVRLHPFLCHWKSGQAEPLASDEIRWVAPDELTRYQLPKANDSLVVELFAYLLKAHPAGRE